MRVCLVETYYGGSHRAWADGFSEASTHDVTLLTLPAENWRWRMRGGPVLLLEDVKALAAEGYVPDVLLVSEMIDLGLFLSLIEPVWGRPPTVLYFHENQISYPSQKGTDPAFGFLNWTSALVADEVWFNSEYHRTAFLDAIPGLLLRFPDAPRDDGVELIRSRSEIQPVGVGLIGSRPVGSGGDRARILWNHRWEHDKAPGDFIKGLREIAAAGLEFDLVICGEEPLSVDSERDEFISAMGERIVWTGYAPRDRYLEIVRSCDIVVSTARQENFGVSAVEAMSAGLCPVFPDRLSYPELLTGEFAHLLYPSGGFVPALSERISDLKTTREIGGQMMDVVARFGLTAVVPAYDQRLTTVQQRVSGISSQP